MFAGESLPRSDEVDDKIFWPFAKTQDYNGRDPSDYERDPYGERWPMCYGACSSGKCELNQSKPGCCYSNRGSGKHGSGYGHDAKAEGEVDITTYAANKLICWEGEQNA